MTKPEAREKQSSLSALEGDGDQTAFDCPPTEIANPARQYLAGGAGRRPGHASKPHFEPFDEPTEIQIAGPAFKERLSPQPSPTAPQAQSVWPHQGSDDDLEATELCVEPLNLAQARQSARSEPTPPSKSPAAAPPLPPRALEATIALKRPSGPAPGRSDRSDTTPMPMAAGLTAVASSSAGEGGCCRVCGHRDPAATPGMRCPNDPDRVLIAPAVAQRRGRDTLLGRVVGGQRIGLIDVVGRGATASVYKGLDLALNREVALKILGSGGGLGEDLITQRERFRREASILARLTDESAPRIISFGEEPDGVLFIEQEYVRGRTLGDVLERERCIAPERAVEIACDVLCALQQSHDAGLIHRDIKPGNIMLADRVDGQERAKLIDFGIAKDLQADAAQGIQLTQVSFMPCSPAYVAPERVGANPVTPRSDLYSLGVVLYEMLTGSIPFQSTSDVSFLRAHAKDPIPPMPPELGVPAALERAVRSALAKDPARRVASAQQMRAELRGALASRVSSRAPSTQSLNIHNLITAVPDTRGTLERLWPWAAAATGWLLAAILVTWQWFKGG